MPDNEQNNENNVNDGEVLPEQPKADVGSDTVSNLQSDTVKMPDGSSVLPSSDSVTNVATESSASPSVAQQGQAQEPGTSPVDASLVATPAMPTSSDNRKKNNQMLIWGLIALAVVAIVAVVLIFVLGKSDQLSINQVKKYCNDNDLDIITKRQDKYDINTVICTTSEYAAGVSRIEYTVAKQPIMDLYGHNEGIDSTIWYNSYNGSTLIDEKGYRKDYVDYGGYSSYMIIMDNTVMVINGTKEGTKKALIAMGYPDDKWGEEDSDSSSRDDKEDKDDTLQVSQRDTQRRSDMARVMTAIVDYQANNNGNFLEGPSYWYGTYNFYCDETNLACKFVSDYLSSDGSSNDFRDPDDTPYSIDITENLVSNGAITSDYGSSFSHLEETSDGYTIGGYMPFEEHVVFIVPGGKCGADSNVVKAQSAENIAVMYLLGDGSIYCMDNM